MMLRCDVKTPDDHAEIMLVPDPNAPSPAPP